MDHLKHCSRWKQWLQQCRLIQSPLLERSLIRKCQLENRSAPKLSLKDLQPQHRRNQTPEQGLRPHLQLGSKTSVIRLDLKEQTTLLEKGRRRSGHHDEAQTAPESC